MQLTLLGLPRPRAPSPAGMAAARERRSRFATVLLVVLGLGSPKLAGAFSGPEGTVTALATQTRQYTSRVRMSYFEPVNCTIEFSDPVVSFTPAMISKTDTTVVSNFAAINNTHFTFQVYSMVNENITFYIPNGTVRNTSGSYNSELTGFFYVDFYAYPPTVKLELSGFTSNSTSKEPNIAFLVFNSTTRYDETSDPWFNVSFVSIDPFIQVQQFSIVDDLRYRFVFEITRNTSSPASTCVAPNTALPSSEHSIYKCSLCERTERCLGETVYPPSGVFVEFLFTVNIQPVPAMQMPQHALPLVFDTLWALVSMQGPTYAREPFYVTITWTEPMADLTAIMPAFATGSPPIDMGVMARDRMVLSPTSIRVTIAPSATGIVSMTINGTVDSVDLAGNTNDFRRTPTSRTGDHLVVIYSAGPPLPGFISFDYQRPRLESEYSLTTVPPPVPTTYALTVSWANYITATRYDVWINWGENQSVAEVPGLTGSSHKFESFTAMIGVEYNVYVRAYNNWGQSLVTSRVFLHPQVDFIADGTQSIVSLPSLMGPTETMVPFSVLVPQNGFLSINTLKVLTFRSANKSLGDIDPCRSNTQVTRCTSINFHIEVPDTEFVVFREPIRLQFAFGQNGWVDTYYRPRLRYWETYLEEWRSVVDTCPPEQIYDRWNVLHRIYEVSVCHLSHFALYEDFEEIATTTAAPITNRPDSYGGAAFFVILAGSVLLAILICCALYFACGQQSSKPRTHSELGIRSVTDRLPKRRKKNAGPGFERVAIADGPEADSGPGPQLALPAPPSAQPEPSQVPGVVSAEP